jgi:hypothetical protein
VSGLGPNLGGRLYLPARRPVHGAQAQAHAHRARDLLSGPPLAFATRPPLWHLLDEAYFCAFFRSAQRFRIISEIRFRAAANIVGRFGTPELFLVPGGRPRRLPPSKGLYGSIQPAAPLFELLDNLVNVHGGILTLGRWPYY